VVINLLRRFIHDEVGAVFVVEIMIVLVVLGLGTIAGLAFMRDAFVQELADTGLAVNNLDQSYTVTGVSNSGGDSVNGSSFNDAQDANDGADPLNAPPPGLDLDGHVDSPGVAAEDGSQI
jgi:hypothetical protein